jgi:hypothetical protein
MAKAKPKTKVVKKNTIKKVKPVKKAVQKAAKKVVKKAAPKPKVTKDVVEKTTVTVRSYLSKLFKKNYQEMDGRFILTEGSAVIQIVIRPWYDNDAVVDMFSYVVEGANISPEITNFLLRKNATLHFGAFGLTFDNTIMFSYSLAGMNLDLNELKAALKMVAAISDFYDDEIVKIAGGKRGIDVKEMSNQII